MLARDDQALTTLLESNCQAAFAIANLPACDAEMRSRLTLSGAAAGAGAEQGLLEDLASVAGARSESILVEALSFRDGVTHLRVTAPDVQSLDALAQAIGSDGRFQADIQSTVPGDNGIEGRLQIAELRQ